MEFIFTLLCRLKNLLCYHTQEVYDASRQGFHSLKINELIQSFQAGVIILAQFLLKIPVFDLNSRYVFHRT